jgi:triosephosphate isomerase
MKMIVVGNWKMNLAQSSARELVGSLAQAGAVSDGAVDVIVCPPFTIIGSLSDLRKEGIFIGAQNCHHVAKGAYTGEISAGLEWQHSEKRPFAG